MEIDDNQEEEELDFFLFCQKVILSSNVDLPDDFKSASKVVEIIYNFVKQQFQSTGQLPRGQHALMGTSISFPSRAVEITKIIRNLDKNRRKTHVRNAKWEIKELDYMDLLCLSSTKMYQIFVEYFAQHKKFPSGKFRGQTEVVFSAEVKDDDDE